MSPYRRLIEALEKVHKPSAILLEERNMEERYNKFYSDKRQYTDMPPSEFLKYLFAWDDSEEGHPHWSSVHESLVGLENAEVNKV